MGERLPAPRRCWEGLQPGGGDAPSLFYNPTDRARQRPGHPHRGRRSRHGQGGRLRDRGDERPDRRRRGGRDRRHELLRHPGEAGHPAEELHRRALHQRSVAVSGEGANRAYGADAAFAFFTNLELGGYYARTETRSLDGDDESYHAAVDYAGDLYGASATHLKVGDDFNPEVGFLRRRVSTKSSGTLRYSPRPASIDWVRKLTWRPASTISRTVPERWSLGSSMAASS